MYIIIPIAICLGFVALAISLAQPCKPDSPSITIGHMLIAGCK